MLADLDIPPRSGNSYEWADFAELRAVAHPDHCFSKGDLDGIARRGKDTGGGFDVETGWRDIINTIGNRCVVFAGSYPFTLSDDNDTIFLQNPEYEAENMYLGLLVAACMRNIVKSHQGAVARAFEQISLKVFSSLMPPGSEVRATWAQAGEDAPYVGSLYEKLIQIARDIRCNPTFKAEDFSDRNTGDGGIDIIAWHPMSDARDGIPIAFAQCGCSKDGWGHKQFDAAPARHQSRLPARHLWANYYFLPVDLRRSDGDWAHKCDLAAAIFVDRLRLLGLAAEFGLFGEMPEMPFIANALAAHYA